MSLTFCCCYFYKVEFKEKSFGMLLSLCVVKIIKQSDRTVLPEDFKAVLLIYQYNGTGSCRNEKN